MYSKIRVKTSHFYLHSRFSADMQHELERQNKITQQILEAFLQKKLGLPTTVPKAPSILDILPVKMPTPLVPREPEIVEDDMEDMEEDNIDSQELTDDHELREDDSLQSVESEQIDSIYNTEGRYHDSLFHLAISCYNQRFVVTEWIAWCKLHSLFNLQYLFSTNSLLLMVVL